MLKILYFIFLLLLSFDLYAYSKGYYYKHTFLPQESELISHTEFSYYLGDFDLEDESSDQDIDDFDREQNSLQQSFLYGLSDQIALWGGVSYVFNAQRERKYDQDVNLLEMSSDFEGLEFFEVGVLRRFIELEPQGVEQTMVLKMRSGASRGADDKASLGGVEARASYLFSFNHSWGDIIGSLNAEYFGKKKLDRVDGELQETLPYSAFSLWLGPRLEWGSFYWAALAGFGLMTDFVIRSPSYNRTSDSGFLTRGALLMGYDFGHWGIDLNYKIGSDIFNKTGDGREGNEIDFELETQRISLAVLWKI